MSEARHTRGVAATLALALTLAACAKHSVSTPLKAAPHWPAVRIVGPLPTDSAPAGTIRGIVVDDSTRDGIPGVAVSIVGRARDGRSIGRCPTEQADFSSPSRRPTRSYFRPAGSHITDWPCLCVSIHRADMRLSSLSSDARHSYPVRRRT